MYELAKIGVELVTSFAASNVAATVIDAFKPDNLSKIGKVGWVIGRLAVGGAAAAAGAKYMGDSMDSIRDCVNAFKKDEVSA